jgi:hypothetical protein
MQIAKHNSRAEMVKRESSFKKWKSCSVTGDQPELRRRKIEELPNKKAESVKRIIITDSIN